MLIALRKYPEKYLRALPGVGGGIGFLFRLADRNGYLSDLLADPQRMWEKRRLYSLIRREFFNLETPLVSVIIATRNNADTIELAIRSLQMQSVSNLEIVVIDDASGDGTGDIVKSLQKSDPRIRYFRSLKARGTGRSRNRGLAICTGTYVTFQDGDDFSHPLRIEKQLLALTKSNTAKVSYCNYARVSRDGRRLAVNGARIRRCIISMMFLKDDALEKVGYFRGESISEDSDYSERLKIAFGPEASVTVFRTLYEALYRPTSTFFSHGHSSLNDGRKVNFQPNGALIKSVEEMKIRHAQMLSGELSTFSPYCE